MRDQHHVRKPIEGPRQDAANMRGGRLGLGDQQRPAVLFAHPGKFRDQPVIVHHHQRPLVIAQLALGPTVVTHQPNVARQRYDVGRTELINRSSRRHSSATAWRTPAIEPL